MALRSSSDLRAWSLPGSWTAWCEGWPGSTWGWSRWATYYWPGRVQWAGMEDLSTTSGHLRKTSPGKHLFRTNFVFLPGTTSLKQTRAVEALILWLWIFREDETTGCLVMPSIERSAALVRQSWKWKQWQWCVFVWWPFWIADDKLRSSQRLERPEKKYAPHWHWVLEVIVVSVLIIIIIIFVTIIIDQTS